MKWIETGVWVLACIACTINLIYLLRFQKNESGDERGTLINGRSAVYSFSVLSVLISFIVIFDVIFGFTAELYKLSIGCILIVSNAFFVISHNYIRKQF